MVIGMPMPLVDRVGLALTDEKTETNPRTD
jgi:hypothetical protein